jgi:hypothetical protein
MGIHHKPPPGNVRRVASSGRNVRGVITNKAGRLVQFESWAERALLLRLERDRDVLDYGSQPERFEYSDAEGRRRTYTPDFIVWRGSEQVEIHEVTLEARRKHPEAQLRERAGATICQERGWQYVVHTEQSLPQGTELANFLALFRFRPTAYADAAVAAATKERLNRGVRLLLHALWLDIVRELSLPSPKVASALGHMLWHGQLLTELGQLLFVEGCLSASALVWLPVEVNDEALIQ